MTNFFSDIINRAIYRNYTLLNLFFSSLNWFLAFGIYNNTRGKEIILHYNVRIGADYINSASNIFVFPAVGLLIFIVNFLLSKKLSNDSNGNIHLLLFSSLVLNQLILAALYSLYLINLITF